MTYNTIQDLREARNKALFECDYLLLPDSKLYNYEGYIDLLLAYRQELRDITKKVEEVGLENIKLPEFPSVVFDPI